MERIDSFPEPERPIKRSFFRDDCDMVGFVDWLEMRCLSRPQVQEMEQAREAARSDTARHSKRQQGERESKDRKKGKVNGLESIAVVK